MNDFVMIDATSVYRNAVALDSVYILEYVAPVGRRQYGVIEFRRRLSTLNDPLAFLAVRISGWPYWFVDRGISGGRDGCRNIESGKRGWRRVTQKHISEFVIRFASR